MTITGMLADTPLRGRIALITGVSRRIGIAYALAARLATRGADVLAHSWAPHDAEQPWGADPLGPEGVIQALRAELPPGAGRVAHLAADLGDPHAPARVVDATLAEFGALDILIATHACSSAYDLPGTTAEELDRCWAVNVRGTLLLAQRYAQVHEPARAGGRVVLFPYAEHFLHDLGAFQVGIGVTLLLAVVWSDALALAGFLVANTVHAVNHAVDLDLGGRASDPWLLGLVSVFIAAALALRLREIGYVDRSRSGRTVHFELRPIEG